MKKRLGLCALAAIAGLGIAASAEANNVTMASVCRNFPCVYDRNGQGVVVGIPADGFHLDRQIGSTWYMLAVNEMGLIDNLLLYYTSSDCTGQPYFENIQMPLFAWYDGMSIWTPVGSPISAVYQSYGYGNPWYCTTIASYGAVVLQPAVKGETRIFYAPFKMQ